MYHIAARLARSTAGAIASWVADPAGVVLRAAEAERDRAFLAAPVLLGSGMAAYFALPLEAPWWAVAPALLIAGFAWWQWRRTPAEPVAIAGILVVLGLALAMARVAMVDAPVLRAEVGPAPLAGVVERVERRDDGIRLTVAPTSFGRLRPEDLPGRVKVSVRGVKQDVWPGDRVEMLAKVRPPSSPAEPGAFDFQRHAFFQGIGGYGFALGAPTITPAPASGPVDLPRFRDRVGSEIAATVGPDHGGIAAALITGDRARVAETQWQSLRDSGLAHLLAISGLHMGLVTGFLFFAIRAALAAVPSIALRRPIKQWAALAALAGGGGYLILTGGSVPTIRAFVMVAIVMLAVLADRRAISLRTVAIAALIVLAIMPESLVEPGFQMSFAAVTALVAAYEFYGPRWTTGMGKAGPIRRVWHYLLGVGVTTLIAGAATGPFAIYHFGRFADYGVIANLLAVPIVAFWVMPMGTLGALTMPIGLDQPFFWLMGQGIGLVLSVSDWVAGLPGAVRLVPAMPVWGLTAVVLGGLWLCLLSRSWRWWGLVGIAVGLLSPHLVDRPVLRVDSAAKLMAVHTARGETILTSLRSEKFTAGQWLARDGLASAQPWPTGSSGRNDELRCDSQGCILRRDGWMIALPATPAAAREDCTRADIVVSLEPLQGRCPSARYVIDRFDIWRDGAHAIWVDDTGVRVRSTDGVRGQRIWNPDPLPRKDQYWRNRAASRP